VRKALQLAIDTQTIAKTHFGGLVDGNPAGYISPEYKGWTIPYEEWPEDLQQEYRYDPNGARQLLAEAGYPDGFDTNVYVATEGDLDLIQIIKSYFADIGVDMTINTMDGNELNAFIQAGKHDQLLVTEFCNCTWPVNVSFFDRTSMCATNHVYATADEAAVYDDLYAQFQKASDETKAKQLMIQASEYLYRQHWAVAVTGRVIYDAAQPRVKGFDGEQMTGFSQVWFWTLLWIEQTKK
jgi:ABC-type transport system substrate-binding protein